MSTITIKECDLCDAFNTQVSMFAPVKDVDVCVSCLCRLQKAAEHGLVALDPSVVDAIEGLWSKGTELDKLDADYVW